MHYNLAPPAGTDAQHFLGQSARANRIVYDLVARLGGSFSAEHGRTRAAAERLGNYRLSGLTLVVTLEPCAMCAGAISHARIGRLVFGAADEKGGAVAHGPRFFEQPTCHWRPQVRGGVLAAESAALLRGFFNARRS